MDGHNRYKILQELERLDELQTTELVFGTRENALNWIINNQLGPAQSVPRRGGVAPGETLHRSTRVTPVGGIGRQGGQQVAFTDEKAGRSASRSAAKLIPDCCCRQW